MNGRCNHTVSDRNAKAHETLEVNVNGVGCCGRKTRLPRTSVPRGAHASLGIAGLCRKGAAVVEKVKVVCEAARLPAAGSQRVAEPAKEQIQRLQGQGC
jgi:hypothetical protein